MKKKISKRKKAENTIKTQVVLISIFVLLEFVFLTWHIFAYDVNVSPVTQNVKAPIVSTNISETAIESVGLPVSINIPSINLNATIEKVGMKADGSMDVPKEPMNTAWYELGPRPGEVGSAVIDGHVDWWYSATGVFANLSDVKPGHIIIVTDDAGKIISFVVRDIRTYSAGADATDIFVSNDGGSHLNLITCAGAWDTYANQYSNRLVIFADRDYRK